MGTKMLSVALAAIALGAVTVAPAGAAPEGNTIVEIKNVLEDKCLEFNDPNSSLPALNACTGAATQLFERIPAADGRGELLRNVGDRWCLDGTYSYWIALRGNCDTDNAGHRFELEPQASGAVKLKNQGEFVDAWSWRSRGELTMETPNSTGYQDWRIREVGVTTRPELTEVIRPKNAVQGKCLAEDGTTARITSCDTPTREAYRRVDAGDGKGALQNTSSGKCLLGNEYYEVLLVSCAPADRAQQWTLVRDELSRYRIRNEQTGFYLDGIGDTARAYPYGGGNWQKWELTAA
ncbi:ricin-type beta-trefoil lectin domain protein [Lentzea sp. NPDC051838]|uniref:ricin-type beta-trefoil lectin domain protein n=1 Tax=Lentzea sp. NPDC051838 TaxID=3154849 RepID=UPI00344972F8